MSLVSNKINWFYINLVAVTVFYFFFNKSSQTLIYLNVGKLNSLAWEISMLFDKFSLMFGFTVLLISYSVFNFSYSYMTSQKFFSRFHILLMIFVISMLFLIFSSNLMFMMLGWDGLGLSSYLLVIYYGSVKSFNAGMITVMSNRCGDFLLISCMALLYSKGGWNYSMYKELCFSSNLFMLLLCVGSFTKSAQVPFSAWLPAAMAAPTPVSSLVHSSTLVTAGVYLMFRHMSNMHIKDISLMILSVSMMTMTLASISALNEKDMKKMVALSTLSQLGLMMFSLSSGWFFMAFFHLIIHAFFKAMMFISVGNVIHHSQLYQSMKNTGNLFYSSPFMSTSIFISSLSLCGAPFTAAFFSKEPIIEMMSVQFNSLGNLICLVISVFLTLLYSSRLMSIVMVQYNKMLPNSFLSESCYLLNKGIMILMIPSFTSGAIMFNFSMSVPYTFYYSMNLKITIFLLYATLLIVAMNFYSFAFKTGSYYFFSMWSMLLFSGPLYNLNNLLLSKSINTSTFSSYLNFFSNLVSPYKLSVSTFMGTYFIARSLITVLFLFLMTLLIK